MSPLWLRWLQGMGRKSGPQSFPLRPFGMRHVPGDNGSAKPPNNPGLALKIAHRKAAEQTLEGKSIGAALPEQNPAPRSLKTVVKWGFPSACLCLAPTSNICPLGTHIHGCELLCSSGRAVGVCWWDVTMVGPGPCPSWGGLLCSGCLGSSVLPAWMALGELMAVLDPSGEFLLDAPVPGFASLASCAATRVPVPTALPSHEPPVPSPARVPLG